MDSPLSLVLTIELCSLIDKAIHMYREIATNKQQMLGSFYLNTFKTRVRNQLN
jgi:hypothetical protein